MDDELEGAEEVYALRRGEGRGCFYQKEQRIMAVWLVETENEGVAVVADTPQQAADWAPYGDEKIRAITYVAAAFVESPWSATEDDEFDGEDSA